MLLSEYCLKEVSIIISGQELKSDFIVLEMKDFDAILGMDFLVENNAVIDCRRKRVTFKPATGKRFTFVGRPLKKPKMMVSALQAKRLMSKGCHGYLASVVDKTKEFETKPQDVLVVREYVDVFLEDLPGLAPEREISFAIELLPGTGPISKAPYHMAPAELKELQSQLQELLDKGFIRPSDSPWGAPVLFVKKKDGSFRMCIDYRS